MQSIAIGIGLDCRSKEPRPRCSDLEVQVEDIEITEVKVEEPSSRLAPPRDVETLISTRPPLKWLVGDHLYIFDLVKRGPLVLPNEVLFMNLAFIDNWLDLHVTIQFVVQFSAVDFRLF